MPQGLMNRLAGYLRKGKATFSDIGGTVNAATQLTGIVPSANGGNDTQPRVNYNGLNFNGSTTYLDLNSLPTVADGKKGTMAFIWRFANAASATEDLWSSTSTKLRLIRGSSGIIQLSARNAANTSILQLQTDTSFAAAADTYVILLSWDLATASSGRCAVIKLSDMTVSGYTAVTYTNDTIDYTTTEHSIGAQVSGGTPSTGDGYMVYFDDTLYMDVTTAAVQRRFVEVNGVLRFGGDRGELYSGSGLIPKVFLAYGDSASWADNRGTDTGTYTKNGAIANATTAIYGQYGGYIDRTIIATGTTGAQTINKRIGSVNFAAGAGSLVVTNSLVKAGMPCLAMVNTSDTTLKTVAAVTTANTITLNGNANATAETRVTFFLP